MSETLSQVKTEAGSRAGRLHRQETSGPAPVPAFGRSTGQAPFFTAAPSWSGETAIGAAPEPAPFFEPAPDLSRSAEGHRPAAPESGAELQRCAACEPQAAEQEILPPAGKDALPEVQPACAECAPEEVQRAGEANPPVVQRLEETGEEGPEVQALCADCAHDLVQKQTDGTGNNPAEGGLKVGAPGDPYEREADRMADKVMRMP
ncbi:MAG TPA: hypothetical protein VHK69_12645, partial [Chitinophagaceae bacterium]|nr:hypothetical protein [Chitinophagaceae bacterium]